MHCLVLVLVLFVFGAKIVSQSNLVTTLKSWIGSDLQKPNWDSYGADAISTTTINEAIELAAILDGKTINGKVINLATPDPYGEIVLSDNDESLWITVASLFVDE